MAGWLGESLVLFTARIAVSARPQLSDVVSQAAFDISRLWEAALQRRAEPLLCRGTRGRGQECAPLGHDFGIRWKAVPIGQPLGSAIACLSKDEIRDASALTNESSSLSAARD